MNGEQQRQHKTKMDQLAAEMSYAIGEVGKVLEGHRHRLDTLTTAVETDIPRSFGNLTRAISDLRQDHAELLSAEVNTRTAFTGRGFWSRLNWLVTGR